MTKNMKKIVSYSFLLLVILVGSSMMIDNNEPIGDEYSPIMISRDQLENSIQFQEPLENLKSKRFYIYANYIYLVDEGKGIQIINNEDPSNPTPVQYIRIPGCENVAVRNGIMYTNNATDIVGIDQFNKEVLFRNKEVIDEPVPPGSPIKEYYNRPEGYVVIGWEKI